VSPHPVPPPAETGKPDYLAIGSWALYDFANTIYSMNVVSLYFALWVTLDQGGEDIHYSLALSSSMLAVALSVPIFGAMSDQTGKRRGPLILLTLICVAATGAIGYADRLAAGLLLFILANYCYNASLVFYNGQLPSVSRGSHVGMVSGIGVSLGYLGAIGGLLMVKPFAEAGGRPAAFLPTAAMFLLFSIPCFIFVRDVPLAAPGPLRPGEVFRSLGKTLTHLRQYRFLFRFIIIHFLILDVVNTIIAFMSVYASRVIGFSDAQINSFLVTSTTGAMVGSLIIGWGVKRFGSLRSYLLVLALWFTALLLTVISQTEWLFWCVGPIAGMGMGGVWVVSRAILIELSPPGKVGEFFGFYGMAGKFASILGPLLWGGIVWALQTTVTFKYRAAVFSLLVLATLAIVLFRSLKKDLEEAGHPAAHAV